MLLKKLEIEKFRHIENQVIEFGSSLTVISGLNGTGKSSILGLAGHVFTTPDEKIKTYSGRNFNTEQKEVFRLCPIHDFSNTYKYKVIIQNKNNKDEIINVATRYMPTEKRLKFDIDGRGNKFKWPVIYLGLKRLFPNANESKINIEECDLSKKDRQYYLNELKNIMVVNNSDGNVEHVITNKKNYYGYKTNKYSAIGNSAGQDNIGQILTAVLSFNKWTTGGILLIDEIESTLFPAAQINLINELYKFSKEFKIQIIFTTHSLEIMKYMHNKTWNDIKFNFMEQINGKVKNLINPGIEYIQHKIKAEAKIINKPKYKEIICEDELAALWIKGLLKYSNISKNIRVNYSNMNDGCIKQMAESKMKCFNDFIFVFDGDCKNKKDFKKIKNAIFLPGNHAPEKVMFEYLNQLPDDDPFWTNDLLFDKNACFNMYNDDNLTKDRYKNWYAEKKKYLGKGLSKFFTRWKKDNKKTVDDFINKISLF